MDPHDPHKHLAALIVAKIAPKPPDDGDDPEAGLDTAAEDLLEALQSKDVKGVTAALRSFFQMCERMPHEEGPHEDEDEDEDEGPEEYHAHGGMTGMGGMNPGYPNAKGQYVR